MQDLSAMSVKDKPSLIVHIGAHKTGTTSIQETCVEQWEILRSNGIYYPKDAFINFRNQHSEFAFFYNHEQKNIVQDTLRSISADAKKLDTSRVFISGEEFWNLDAEDVAHFVEVASRYFREVNYVAVLRNKGDYLLSNFKHHLRYSKNGSELAYLRNIPENPHDVLSRWNKYASSNGLVLLYEEMKNNLITAFFKEAFGIDIHCNAIENSSLDFLTLQIYNIFIKSFASADTDRIMWEFIKSYPDPILFQADEYYRQELQDAVSDKGWNAPGVPRMALANEAARTPKLSNPVVICERMIALFERFKLHFEHEAEARKNNLGGNS
jgi:glycosyltransferase involved in cell wall biosynthesis